MSAGQPNWQKLHELGKLPKAAHGKIPMLAQLDAAEARLTAIRESLCDECRVKLFPDEAKKDKPAEIITIKCESEGCEFKAEGKTEAVAKNNLRLHARSHEPKKVE